MASSGEENDTFITNIDQAEQRNSENESLDSVTSLISEDEDTCRVMNHFYGAHYREVREFVKKAQNAEKGRIDLSKMELYIIPPALLQWQSLEYLSVERNNLVKLPENFFRNLPNLQWLDLRFNRLVMLPSTYLANHKKLKNLLLQGNRLRSLPCELGLVRSLRGLSLSENPIEFPSPHIIALGTKEVLRYLRHLLIIVQNADKNKEATKGELSNDDSSVTTVEGYYVKEKSSRWKNRYLVKPDAEFDLHPTQVAMHVKPSTCDRRRKTDTDLRRSFSTGNRQENANFSKVEVLDRSKSVSPRKSVHLPTKNTKLIPPPTDDGTLTPTRTKAFSNLSRKPPTVPEPEKGRGEQGNSPQKEVMQTKPCDSKLRRKKSRITAAQQRKADLREKQISQLLQNEILRRYWEERTKPKENRKLIEDKL